MRISFILAIFIEIAVSFHTQAQVLVAQDKTSNLNPDKASQIINDYVEAIGGRENLRSIHSLTIRGEGNGVSEQMALPMTIYVKNPGKNKVEISVMNQKVVLATDGEVSWGVNPFEGNGQPHTIFNYGTDTSNNVFFTIGKNLIDYRERGFRASYLGKTNFKGKKAHRIRLSSDYAEDDYYIDAETHYLLMAKVDYTKNYFGDYKKVGNIVFPHLLEGGKRDFKMEVNEVIINDPIDDDEFQIPYVQFNSEENILLNQNIEDETFEFNEEEVNAYAIVAQYVGKVGNNWDLIDKKNVQIQGQMTMGSIEVPFRILSKKSKKFRMEVEIMNQMAIMATNGKTAWEVSPLEGSTEPTRMDNNELEESSSIFTFGRDLVKHYQERRALEYLGKTSVKGKESHVIKVSQAGQETLYFIDTKTDYLLLKHEKNTGTQEFYEDYQPVGNLLIPHQIESHDRLENTRLKVNFEQFLFDEKMSNRLFEFPN